MELIYSKNEIIGSVDKLDSSRNSGWFATVIMENESEDKEAFFTLKKDAVQFVKQEYKKIVKNQSKNQSGMKKPATKKATPAQLAARKRFAEMAKNGTLAKKRAAASKKKKGLKKPTSKGLTTLCAKTVGVPGRRKKDGTQKKGYVATKGGTLKKKVVKKVVKK